ncbi:MAG TPA: VWA domain-containing protein [Leptospiraceae bacterium]|nr:VWA domain-containing protein [Leptospiraceae bacterium]HMW04949.1 VWA domain-containing protein [Leptospiraceae bacterium]HMX31902.1 VWA domain-containing protein [Leptospiraceae bacterium]HMY30830.1 VWA domain-containing protein [Leptospiraceae bacterium]HMZ64291.1 VWA domain-containing protein [Leptospiraceae bacterium]
MIDFENILQFFWVLPWIAFIIYLYRKQRIAFEWVDNNVSKRFSSVFTEYKNLNHLKLHILIIFAMGLLLIIAVAGPRMDGMVEDSSGKGKVILLLDGSFSMLSNDTSPHPVTKKYPEDRFAEAQIFSEELIDANPDYAYGLITFSGKPAVHSLPINDIITIKTFVHTLLVHNFESTGSSFKSALQEVLKIVYESEGNIQVILLSDGEVPEDKDENLEEELQLLKRNNVVVHTIGVGTEKGGGVNFFVSYTEEEKKEMMEKNRTDDSTGTKRKEVDQKIIKNIKTHRSDKILKQIAEATNGQYLVVEKGKWVEDLNPYLKETSAFSRSKIKTSGKIDLSIYFLLAFFLIFVIHNFPKMSLIKNHISFYKKN